VDEKIPNRNANQYEALALAWFVRPLIRAKRARTSRFIFTRVVGRIRSSAASRELLLRRRTHFDRL
jgi:hypothetical protein